MKRFPYMPYPGRGILVGNSDHNPAFGYFVTVRTPKYRGRKLEFVEAENAYRTLPFKKEDFDPLLHYRAVTMDKDTGLLLVSNSEAPVDPLMEHYKKLLVEDDAERLTQTDKILGSIGTEPDDLKTPRIICLIYPQTHEVLHVFGHLRAFNHLGIVTKDGTDSSISVYSGDEMPNAFFPLTTYTGNLDTPQPFDAKLFAWKNAVAIDSTTPEQMVEEIYEGIYADTPKGDLRVCAIAGIYSGDMWKIEKKNRFNTQEEFDTFMAEAEKQKTKKQ